MAATTWVRSPLGSCLGDMAVRMPDRGLVFERVHLLLLFEKSYLSCRLCQVCVNSHNKNRMTHPPRVAKNYTTHPLPRVQKLMTTPSLLRPTPLYFLTSPLLIISPQSLNNFAKMFERMLGVELLEGYKRAVCDTCRYRCVHCN